MKTTMNPPLWPGRKEYSMNTNEGKAILGSPNGRGVALLLIQHKAQLGERTTIEKVAVFGEGEDGSSIEAEEAEVERCSKDC